MVVFVKVELVHKQTALVASTLFPRVTRYTRIRTVDSTGERNGLYQCISRRAVAEGLAGSAVELQRDGAEVVLAIHREVGRVRISHAC